MVRSRPSRCACKRYNNDDYNRKDEAEQGGAFCCAGKVHEVRKEKLHPPPKSRRWEEVGLAFGHFSETGLALSESEGEGFFKPVLMHRKVALFLYVGLG